MNGAKESVLVCIFFLVISCLTTASPVNDQDSSINDLYENLLQREYTGPIPLSDHQVERKAVRSPSLRLRFGRRSDPNMSPFLGFKFMDKVNQKPIRSPSLRLRFGRRNDPNFPPNFSGDLLNEEFHFNREERKPASRLRWGRSAAGDFSSGEKDLMFDIDEMAREIRKPKILRFGRSGNNFKDEIEKLNDSELRSLAAQYLLNEQESLRNFADNTDHQAEAKN